MNCLVEDYIKFVKNFLINYYKLLLDSKYEKKLVIPFVEKYIDVRYYNNTIYERTTNFVEKVNKELILVAKEIINENKENEEKIKNIFALFGYVLYLDDCSEYASIKALIKTLFADENIKLEYSEVIKENFKALIEDFNKQKEEFFKLFDIKDFELKTKRYKRNLYHVDILQHCNISPIFSEYAIEKAYNSEVVTENKIYLLYIMLSFTSLKDVIARDYNRRYVVDFPTSLFSKTKKITKYLKVLDSEILKNKISIKFTYRDFLQNKDIIKKFINQGYSIAMVLDETFDNDFECLVLFSYVFVYEKYDYYDIIMDSKENIKTNIVTL